MKTHFTIYLFFLFLVSCATVPTPTDQATPVADSRFQMPNLKTSKDGTGPVIVKRDSGFVGSGCTHYFFVDGESVAEINSGEKVEIFLPLGEHILSVKTARILCMGYYSEAVVNVEKNKIKKFRIHSNAGGISLIPTAF